ncbi:MAG TPA: 4Fe-4S binding protein [Terriglobia bacterium]|nr:4Fe-4S binding protein [Terriglobia bacterium]
MNGPLTGRGILALLLLTTVCAFAPVSRASAAVRQSVGQSVAQSVAQSEDPPAAGAQWDFGDEEEEAAPSWTDDLREQAPGVILLTGFCVLTLVGFLRKSERLKWITMGASVVYLGFMQSQLISVVNIFALTQWNLPQFRHNLAWYVFAVFTLVTTILWGRIYCGRVCAFGSMTQLLDKIVPARLRIEIPARIEQRANYIKYGLLAGVVAYYLATHDISIYRYVEPFWLFSRAASTGLWIGLAALLIATVFVRNLYCRFLCPVGAFLGLLSNLTVFRIKRWGECNTCRICEKACEWGAIRGPKIVASECVRCDDCERLYDDKEKCPHWLILARKAKKEATARASG